MSRNGQFALYENPRAGTVHVTLMGEPTDVIVSVLGVWTNGEEQVRYLIVGGPSTTSGGNVRWIRGADLDISVESR